MTPERCGYTKKADSLEIQLIRRLKLWNNLMPPFIFGWFPNLRNEALRARCENPPEIHPLSDLHACHNVYYFFSLRPPFYLLINAFTSCLASRILLDNFSALLNPDGALNLSTLILQNSRISVTISSIFIILVPWKYYEVFSIYKSMYNLILTRWFWIVSV